MITELIQSVSIVGLFLALYGIHTEIRAILDELDPGREGAAERLAYKRRV